MFFKKLFITSDIVILGPFFFSYLDLAIENGWFDLLKITLGQALIEIHLE